MNYKHFQLVNGFYKRNHSMWRIPARVRNYLLSRLVEGEFVTPSNTSSPKFLIRLDALDAIIKASKKVEQDRVVDLIWKTGGQPYVSVDELRVMVSVES